MPAFSSVFKDDEGIVDVDVGNPTLGNRVVSLVELSATKSSSIFAMLPSILFFGH